MADQRRHRCRYCGKSFKAWKTRKDGVHVNGLQKLVTHISDDHGPEDGDGLATAEILKLDPGRLVRHEALVAEIGKHCNVATVDLIDNHPPPNMMRRR